MNVIIHVLLVARISINIELRASNKCRSARQSAQAIYYELRASDKCRSARQSAQAIYYERYEEPT